MVIESMLGWPTGYGVRLRV